jgi:hypothetical protein
MVYDSRRQRVVLFGGYGDGTILGDTWEFDGSSWQKVADGGPSPRAAFGMAFDSARGKTVVFGGARDRGEPTMHDTWEWDGREWQRKGTSGPPPRDHHAMTYDSRRQRVLVFGGGRQLPNGSFPADTTGAWLRDLWAWDGTSWTQLAESGPPSRGGLPGLAYDSRRDRVVLFGGGHLDGTWEWDGHAWRQVNDPPARRGAP